MKWVTAALVVAIGLALHLLIGTVAAVAGPGEAGGREQHERGECHRSHLQGPKHHRMPLCAWTVREEITRLTALDPGADPRVLLRRTDIPLFCELHRRPLGVAVGCRFGADRSVVAARGPLDPDQ
jgi:type IV secretion system protein VirD4